MNAIILNYSARWSKQNGPDDDDMGDLVETAVFAQWFHSMYLELYYARWRSGEVDIVHLGPDLRPVWAVEVKWSDRFEEDPSKLKSLIEFCRTHKDCELQVTTRTKQSSKTMLGRNVPFLPASLYCYLLGYNIIKGLGE